MSRPVHGRKRGVDPVWTARHYCKCGHHRDAHTYESGICLAQMCECQNLRVAPAPVEKIRSASGDRGR